MVLTTEVVAQATEQYYIKYYRLESIVFDYIIILNSMDAWLKYISTMIQ